MKEVPRICLVVVFAFHLGLKVGLDCLKNVFSC